jgi:hypothetical protein
MFKPIPKHIIDTFSHTPEVAAVLSTDHVILWHNDAFDGFVKWAKPENSSTIDGCPYFDFLSRHLHKDELVLSEIKQGIEGLAVSETNCFTYLLPVFSINGARWYMLTACIYHTDKIDKSYIFVRMYNITKHHLDRKQALKTAENNLVRQIIGESMHTWRQPLNSISLFTQDIREQFEDGTLTKYYMNFAVKQMQSEVQRLSASLDEMAAFYNNDTEEETLNLAEEIFKTVESVRKILCNNNILISVKCHAIGNIQSESFINITENFSVRCGTGTKRCFQGCNKGNIVIYGDAVLYRFIMRSMISLSVLPDSASQKNVSAELTTGGGKLYIRIIYDHTPSEAEAKLEFISILFEDHFPGQLTYILDEKGLDVLFTISQFKTKNPL